MKVFLLTKLQLDPEQKRLLDGFLADRDLVVDTYRLMRKKYSAVKSHVKRIECRLSILAQQLPENCSTTLWIGHEIMHIENKYPGIDKAISRYKTEFSRMYQLLKTFHSVNPPSPLTFNDQLQRIRQHLNSCRMYIASALDDIRITQRYFKNITSAFKSAALTIEYHRMQMRRNLFQQQAAPSIALVVQQEPGSLNS